MKIFYAMFLLMYITACTTATVDVEPIADTTSPEVITQIEEAISELPEEEVVIVEEEPVEVVTQVEEVIVEIPEKEVVIIEEELVEVIEPIEEKPEPVVEVSEAKVVELTTTYNNPKGEVTMNIEYELTTNGTIASIDVTSPNYRNMTKFNSGIQKVIGMTIEEASKESVAGSSLGTVAYQNALKNL